MTRENKALKVQNHTDFTVETDTTSNPSSTHRERRVRITSSLSGTNFAINTSKIDQAAFAAFAPFTAANSQVQAANPSIIQGLCWVQASVDQAYSDNPVCSNFEGGGAKNNYKIKAGQQICLDYITGNRVTGIHPCWGADEYKVIGTALESFNGPGQARILASIVPPTVNSSNREARLIKLTEDMSATTLNKASAQPYMPDGVTIDGDEITVTDPFGSLAAEAAADISNESTGLAIPIKGNEWVYLPYRCA